MENRFKILFGALGIMLIAWLGLFFYNRYWKNNNGTIQPAISPFVQLPHNISKEEEKTLKSLAENFVSGYGSYQKGTFNSLKEAQKMMTKKYQEETTRFIEEKEKEQSLESAPKEYISYTSIPTKTTLVSLDSKNANVLIDFEYSIFYGVSLYLNEILTTVDQNGEKTAQPLKREMVKKQATVLMIKENGLWKVDSIKIK